MKLLASIILISIVNYILVAYSDGGASQNQSLIQTNSSLSVTMKDQVQINSKASSTQERRILVSGKTNLPDHTELLISVVNDATGFIAQDKSTVMNRIFSAGPLGQMKGVSAGNYVIEISMPVSKFQPASVQKIIGVDGEYLSGPIVKETSWGGKIVEYSFPYKIGTQASIAKAESNRRELVSEVTMTIKKLLKAGRSMEVFRNIDDLSALRTCGNKMRQNQKKAKLVREKAKSLPMKYLNLRVSSIEIYFCVSCSNSALESCKRATDSLSKLE